MKYVPDSNSPEWGLCYAINYLVTKMRYTTMQTLREAGCVDLSLDQYECLFVIYQNNGIHQRQISKVLLKDRPNVSRILKFLEEKKLVLRKTNKDNKKIQEVYITELGKQLVYIAAPHKNACGEKFLKNFTEEELQQLQMLIEKMSQNTEGLYTINI